jgi:hypothetical protein
MAAVSEPAPVGLICLQEAPLMLRACVLCVWILGSVSLLRAEEVLRTRQGKAAHALVTSIDADGTVSGIVGRDRREWELGALQAIQFAGARGRNGSSSRPHRIALRGRQMLSARVLGMDGSAVRVRVEDGSILSLPRAVVAAIQERCGVVTQLAEDFEQGLGQWRTWPGASLTGRQRHSGRQAVRLASDTPGAMEHRLGHLVREGKVTAYFYDDTRVEQGTRFFVEAEFVQAGVAQRVRVVLGWEGASYSVVTQPWSAMSVQPLARRKGWRRLDIHFNGAGLIVTVDSAVLAKGAAPAGPLVRLRLGTAWGVRRRRDPRQPPAALLDDIRVVRHVDTTQRRQEDPRLDEVLLAEGDQLFGRIEGMSPSTIAIRGPYGRVEIPWARVHSVRLSRQPIEPRSLAGWFVDVDTTDGDHLTGVLRGLDGRWLRLETALAGDLRLGRARLERLTPVFRGARLAIDSNYHHLGDEMDEELAVPEPEGARFEASFTLAKPPADKRTFIALTVVQMVGAGPDSAYAAQLKAGELRTYLDVNGTRVGSLNDHVARQTDQALRIRMPLPPGLLRVGANRVVIHTTPTKGNITQYDDFGFWGLALETEHAKP